MLPAPWRLLVPGYFETGPPEKMIVGKVRLRLLLAKLVMTLPGARANWSPTLTCIGGTATQVLAPSFSRQM